MAWRCLRLDRRGAASHPQSVPSSSHAECKGSGRRFWFRELGDYQRLLHGVTSAGGRSAPGLPLRRVTTSVGPVLGGWLVAHGSWRWIFFINLPMAVVVIVVTALRFRRAATKKQSGVWTGRAPRSQRLVSEQSRTLSSMARPRHRTKQRFGVWARTGVVVLISFLVVEERSPAPMVSLHLFRSRGFSGANLLTFAFACAAERDHAFSFRSISFKFSITTDAGRRRASSTDLADLRAHAGREDWWPRYGARLPLTIGTLVAATGFALFSGLESEALLEYIFSGSGCAGHRHGHRRCSSDHGGDGIDFFGRSRCRLGSRITCRASPDYWPSLHSVSFSLQDSTARSIAGSSRCNCLPRCAKA